MPELPEVEVVVRKLRPGLIGKTIEAVSVRRLRVIAPTSEQELVRKLTGARLVSVARRAKYIVFEVQRGKETVKLIGHLGMSGDMYIVAARDPEPKHTAVVLSLGQDKFIYEDTRYFGRFTLDSTPLEYLGPEPLGKGFKLDKFAASLRCSSQPVKVKLLDQCLVAGLGNIYASEALFHAEINPRTRARRLTKDQVARLWKAIPKVLTHAIRFGTTRGDGYLERLAVYAREGKPCRTCKTPIRRIVQGGRSTYFCPKCQR